MDDLNVKEGSVRLVEVAPDVRFKLLPWIGQDEIPSILEKAFDFDLTNIRSRYIRDFKVSEECALLHEQELRRYLALCAIFDEPIGMKGPVDLLWHTFLLFTRDYMDFCHQVAGDGVFIHHTPNVTPAIPASKTRKSGVPRDYVIFWFAYQFVFKAMPPKDAWPPLQKLLDEAGIVS